MFTIDTTKWNTFLFDLNWWKKAFFAARTFCPRFIPCAIGITISNLITIAGSAYMVNAIRELQGATMTETDLQKLLITTGCSFIGMLVSIGIALWGLSSWLFNLTAFARAFVAHNGAIEPSHVATAIEETATRKGFIARVWLLASLYLVPSVLPLTGLVALKTLFWSSAPVMDVSSTMPQLFTPTAYISAFALAWIFTVISFGYSFLVIAFSSSSENAASKTATIALFASLKQAPNLFILTTLILLANIAITSPQIILALVPAAAAFDTPITEGVAQVWLGLTSVIVWPLSLAPYCQIIRRDSANG